MGHCRTCQTVSGSTILSQLDVEASGSGLVLAIELPRDMAVDASVEPAVVQLRHLTTEPHIQPLHPRNGISWFKLAVTHNLGSAV